MFNKKSIYIIAEVGQNHQGDVNKAFKYIKEFSQLGADAAKFQMRDNKFLFDNEMFDSPYFSNNAFGNTYGEHREFLELSVSELGKLRDFCKECNVDFICTPFDEPSLDSLSKLNPDAIKIASFDMGNIIFLEKVGLLNKPVILSTGGANLNQINLSIESLKLSYDKLAVLHCVSKYPCPPDDLLLKRIPFLIEKYPDLVIGISDHFNGILSGPISYMLGARVFEKHVTFDRSLKGTDHSFSLEREGFRKFVRDIKRVPLMLKFDLPSDLGSEPVFKRLGKSVIAIRDIPKDKIITKEDLGGKIFKNPGVPIRDVNLIIGSISDKFYKAGEKLGIINN